MFEVCGPIPLRVSFSLSVVHAMPLVAVLFFSRTCMIHGSRTLESLSLCSQSVAKVAPYHHAFAQRVRQVRSQEQ